jgi:hypothetical protein
MNPFSRIENVSQNNFFKQQKTQINTSGINHCYGTPGNAHQGGYSKIQGKDGNVWMLGKRVLYLFGSGKHLSTMMLIKTTL